MKTKLLLLLLSPIFFFTCSTYSEGTDYSAFDRPNKGTDQPPNAEPGKCYAKCLVSDSYSYDSTQYQVFTGDEKTENVDLETIEIVTKPGGSKWVKKPSPNCRSKDPKDCLVWCLEENPAETKTLKVVKDINQTSNYKTETVVIKTLQQKGGFTEWKEVVCSNNITLRLIQQVQQALITEGYYRGELAISAYLDNPTKAALTSYQKEMELPVGNLDFETLNLLNISL